MNLNAVFEAIDSRARWDDDHDYRVIFGDITFPGGYGNFGSSTLELSNGSVEKSVAKTGAHQPFEREILRVVCTIQSVICGTRIYS